jgi:hypothetical protein
MSNDGFWDMLAWDDEDTADPPYVQIYSDNGCLAALYYTTPDEHEQALEFARQLMLLKAKVDG